MSNIIATTQVVYVQNALRKQSPFCSKVASERMWCGLVHRMQTSDVRRDMDASMFCSDSLVYVGCSFKSCKNSRRNTVKRRHPVIPRDVCTDVSGDICTEASNDIPYGRL